MGAVHAVVLGDAIACELGMRVDLYTRPGVIALWTSAIDVDPHRHHALQLTLAAKAFEVDVSGRSLSTTAIAIAPNTPHRLEASEALVVLVEPESRLGIHLQRTLLKQDPFVELEPPAHALAADSGAAASQWLSILAPGKNASRDTEPRIVRTLTWLDALDASEDLPAATLELAHTRVSLSQSRFLHLFKDAVGVPWRRYLLWRRLQHAMRRALAGSTLTEAAHAAGFADAAHLSRTFRSMFGTTPSEIVRGSQFVQAP